MSSVFISVLVNGVLLGAVCTRCSPSSDDLVRFDARLQRRVRQHRHVCSDRGRRTRGGYLVPGDSAPRDGHRRTDRRGDPTGCHPPAGVPRSGRHCARRGDVSHNACRLADPFRAQRQQARLDAGGGGSFPSYSVLSGDIAIGGVHIKSGYIVAAIAAVVLIAAVWFVVMRTQVGRSLRSIASDFRMAELLGINVKLYSVGGSVIVGMVAGFAGFSSRRSISAMTAASAIVSCCGASRSSSWLVSEASAAPWLGGSSSVCPKA